MAKSQFSETQFVMGFLGEYFKRYRLRYPKRKAPFTLPTTSVEPIFGSDFIIQGLSNIEFYQFKRSEFMRIKRGDREIKSGLPKSFRPYYRFKIYNKGTIPQFDRLRHIASLHPRFKAYYCAPKFSTNNEFFNFFWNQDIIDNTAIINCNQFNQSGFFPPYFNINDGNIHYIVFNKTDTTGYLCSDKKGFKLTKDILKETEFHERGTRENLEFNIEIIDTLFNSIIEDEKVNIELVSKYSKTANSRLDFSARFLLQEYGIITQLKYDI